MNPTITTAMRTQLRELAARAERRDLRQRAIDAITLSLSPILGVPRSGKSRTLTRS